MPDAPKRYKAKIAPGVRVIKTAPSSDGTRPTAHKRGYTGRWQRVSKRFLADNPCCVACERAGYTTEATVVDHVIPHKGNQTVFWDESNWQALCKPCHDRKTGKGK